ncbi:hypothetical protein L873DRAFT_1805183 [Choiromyces venosus 120613-1]|uniref:Uncharacterized protein n=1 Tax=Choiromyces venosus 120613-1 TaxID=1336337 RepID=A0A3N4JW52_9PEZI|nr:hypothetical protein L873DRAFT_1805183 [Choiromyces venosus 120613-1]
MTPILCSYTHKPIPSKHLTEWTIGMIYGLHERDIPLREISNYLNIPLTTIHNGMVVGYQGGKQRKGRGRYPKTSKAQNDAAEKNLKSGWLQRGYILMRLLLRRDWNGY